jgi:alpha-tubulin suppressor-like RCC1 family protein
MQSRTRSMAGVIRTVKPLLRAGAHLARFALGLFLMTVALGLAADVATAETPPLYATAWGVNDLGELGTGTATNSSVPLVTPELSEVTAVSAGAQFSLALRKSGVVMSWGYNASGELGDGSTTQRTVPVAVSNLSEVAAISAGGYHSMALLKNATVKDWGFNGQGELGTGNTTNSSLPVAVPGLNEVAAVAAGGYHSLALLKNGKVMSWGYNPYGQLGNGTTTNSLSPVAVSNLSEVTAVSGGYLHSLALMKNGTVKAWGANELGELGNGTTTGSAVPVPVSNLTEVVAISAGYQFSLALRKNGTVMAWGYNASGELGDGTTTQRTVPVAVGNLSEVAAISAGGYHSMALLKNGTVKAWGFNGKGELGNNTTTNSSVPVAVSGLSEASAISAGAYHSLAARVSVGTQPTNTAAPAISSEGSWREGRTVNATTGTWTGTQPISYSYQWESCDSGGGACVNLAGANGSSVMPPASVAHHTLRVIVTASNSAGAKRSTSPASPQVSEQAAPQARVLDSTGQLAQSYGAAYAGEPGGQIQLAENYAHAHGDSTVTLDSGTFTITVPYGRSQPVWPKCEAIFAYSQIALRGAGLGASVIQNSTEASNPCQVSGWVRLNAVVYVGADPTNINTGGTSLNVSRLAIHTGYNADSGLLVGPTTGSGLALTEVATTGSIQAAIELGTEPLPVVGTASSPVRVVGDVVENAHNEGIVAEGSYMTIASNRVVETGAHAIAAFGPKSTYIEVSQNTIIGSSWGVSFDGSESPSSVGEHNSAFANTIENTCVGTVLFKQIDDYVALNHYSNPYTGWRPTGYNQGCPEFPPTGIAISNSYDNFAWSNQIFNFEDGVWVFDGGQSPGGVGTHYNYVGRVPAYGQPWPWPVAGNWIEHPVYGLVATSYGQRPAAVSENEFVGNAVHNYTGKVEYFEAGTKEISLENG